MTTQLKSVSWPVAASIARDWLEDMTKIAGLAAVIEAAIEAQQDKLGEVAQNGLTYTAGELCDAAVELRHKIDNFAVGRLPGTETDN